SLRRGDHARPRRRETPLVRVVAEQDDGIGAEPSRAPVKTGNGSVTPAEVRPRLGELVAENLSELERVLVETATGADKPVWVTTPCKSCGRAGRHEVVIPDYRVRLDAVEKLLQQGLGRAPGGPGAAERSPARERGGSGEPVLAGNAGCLRRHLRRRDRGRPALGRPRAGASEARRCQRGRAGRVARGARRDVDLVASKRARRELPEQVSYAMGTLAIQKGLVQ